MIKLRYSIASIGTVNFWAIPKCGNTSIKHELLSAFSPEKIIASPDETYRWVHSTNLMKYITPDEAISNGKINFTVVRDPVSRFYSLHRDFCIRRKDIPQIYGMTIQELVSYLENNKQEESLNIHCRSMNYFLQKFKGKRFKLENYTGNKLNTTSFDTIINASVSDRVRALWKEDYKWMCDGTGDVGEWLKTL